MKTTVILKRILFNYFSLDINNLNLCSFLTWKNEVYFCDTSDNKKYAVKYFKFKKNALSRYLIEKKAYEFFVANNILFVPRVLFKRGFVFKIIVTEWIDNRSLKEIVNESGIIRNKQIVLKMLESIETLWMIDDKKFLRYIKKFSYKKNKFSYRANVTMKSAIKKLKLLNYNNKNQYDNLYHIYNWIKKNHKIKYQNLINSDISLHECLIVDNNCYWLDFEDMHIGNINNDLAGIYFSLSNSLLNNQNEIDYLFSLLKNNKYYNTLEFIYYLIERLIAANYLDAKNDYRKQINYYEKFIIKLWKEDKNN